MDYTRIENKDIFTQYPDIMNVSQLCEALQIGRNTAYQLLNSGIIKSVRIGKIHKIPKKNVINYLNQ